MKTEISLADIRQFGNVELLARQLVEGFITGLHKSPFHGFSVEFAEHRLYNTGESTRYIDWKVFSRTDKLFVKRYEEETNLRCHLLLDTSPSMYYPEATHGKLTFSAMAAACLTYLLQRQRDAVSLCTFSDKIDLQTPVRSTPAHVQQVFGHLNNVLKQRSANRQTAAADVIHEIAEQIHRRSLVVIFSDMFDRSANADALFGALQHLRHNQHEVLIFHVTDKRSEVEFAFDNRPYEFVDVETGERLKLQPAEVRVQYQQAVQAYFQELRLRCAQYRIDFVDVDIAAGFAPTLSAYFAKRGRMH